jgi:uncharacterized peroxidase-related enzyme
MSWIKIIKYDEATNKLKRLYDKIKGPNNYIDNIMLVHSLRPNTLEGHMTLYKNTLHHANNTLPKWFLEAIGVYVSMLNQCDYCVRHHFTGMAKGVTKDQADQIKYALETGRPEQYFKAKELSMMRYASALTLTPGRMAKKWVTELHGAGLTDGEILEVNQVVAYFCYANRTVLGLGVNNDNEVIGLSPGRSDDPENWHHE